MWCKFGHVTLGYPRQRNPRTLPCGPWADAAVRPPLLMGFTPNIVDLKERDGPRLFFPLFFFSSSFFLFSFSFSFSCSSSSSASSSLSSYSLLPSLAQEREPFQKGPTTDPSSILLDARERARQRESERARERERER